MGLRIANNIAAMNTHRWLTNADNGLAKSLERLSSGFRINRAADDAAGLAISERFRAQIASLKVAQRNVSEANALLQTAEGGMNKIGEVLTRMKELATQAASGNAGADIGKLSSEYNTLVLEIDRISDSTKYADTKLLDGTFNAGNTTTTWDGVADIYNVSVLNAATGAHAVAYSATANEISITKGAVTEVVDLTDGANVNFSTLGISFTMTPAAAGSNALMDAIGAAVTGAGLSVTAGAIASFQVGYGNDASDSIGVSISSVQSADLTLAADDISTAAKASAILDDVETAISTVVNARGTIGAYQNRLIYAGGNLATTVENFQAAESVIRDVDMALEMTAFTKNQILLQAGTAMLAQANLAPTQVLTLFA